MEDVRFYDWEFHLLYIAHDFTSLNWDIYYNKTGTFEGHFPQTPELLAKILDRKHIVCTQGNKQAIVTGQQCVKDKDEFAVYGKTCNWLLTRRPVRKFNTNDWTNNKDIPGIVQHILRQGFSEETADNSLQWEIPDAIQTPDDYCFRRDSINTCSAALIDLLDDVGAGHDVVYDKQNKRWLLRVLQGHELPLVVSQDNRNAYNLSYSRDIQNYYTNGIYEYTPEAENNPDDETVTEPEIKEIDDGSGATGLYRWVAVLNGSNESEARADLKTKKIIEETTATMHRLQLGVDYHLGDTVRLQTTFGGRRQTVRKRITGVRLWYEQGNIGEEPVFEEENNAEI